MKCKRYDCIYRGHLSRVTAFCDYIGHTNRMRDCDPASCDKYKKMDKVALKKSNKHRCDIVVSMERDNIIRYKEGGA